MRWNQSKTSCTLFVLASLLLRLQTAHTSTYEESSRVRQLLQSTPGSITGLTPPVAGLTETPPVSAPGPSTTSNSRALAPAPTNATVATRAPAPSPNTTAAVPAPASNTTRTAPAPAPTNATQSRAPAPSPNQSAAAVPGPAPSIANRVPVPAPSNTSRVPAPAPLNQDGVMVAIQSRTPAPTPLLSAFSPAPAPTSIPPTPSPLAINFTVTPPVSAPAPVPSSGSFAPRPAPTLAQIASPLPSPELLTPRPAAFLPTPVLSFGPAASPTAFSPGLVAPVPASQSLLTLAPSPGLPSVPAPAPSAPSVLQVPVPAPSNGSVSTAPRPSLPPNSSSAPAPAPALSTAPGVQVSAPVPAPQQARLSPQAASSGPSPSAGLPAGQINSTSPGPAPAPNPQISAPNPAPQAALLSPQAASPAPQGFTSPAPARSPQTGLTAGQRNVTSPSPAPAPGSGLPAATAPANATTSAGVPSPSPQSVSVAPAPSSSILLPGTNTTGSPGPAPGPSRGNGTAPGPAPGPSRGNATAPGPAPGPTRGNATAPGPSRGSAPAPGPAQQAATAPVVSPSPLAPAPSNRTNSPAPAPGPQTVLGALPIPGTNASTPGVAPSPSNATRAIAPSLAGSAPSPAPRGPSQAPAPSRTAPAPAPGAGQVFAPTSPGLRLAPAPRQGQSLSPNGALTPSAFSPSGRLTPALAPGPASLLRELYPASALAPAPAGDFSTLVTVASTGQSSGVQVVDSRTGLARSALPGDLNSGSALYAAPGSLNVIVQTSESQSNLPASAIQVEGATVNSVTPVSGSDGRLFNVGLTTNSGASTVAVSTIAGITLASGLTSLASNRLQINLATPNPQVSIRTGSGYESGQTVTPSFTVDFGGRVAANDPSGLYTLSGAERSDVVYDIQNGRIFITAYILPSESNLARSITVTVPAGVTTDLSGTPNSAATYTYSYTPPNPSYTTVSKTVNAVGGATMGAAVVAPLAVGLLASGPAAATVTALGTFSILQIVRGLQFTYLAGQMNVQNLPPNFRQVANSFQWSVLNFRAPWQSAHGNTVSSQRANNGFSTTPTGVTGTPAGRKLLQRAAAPVASNGTITIPSVTGGDSQYVVTSTGLNQSSSAPSSGIPTDLVGTVTDAALGDSSDPYDTLWRAIFWTGIGLIAVTVIAVGLSFIFAYKNWTVPIILQSPRPQFILLITAVPSVAQACAGLFAQGGGKDIAVGVIICVVFPAMMVGFSAWFVARNIFEDKRRRAAWVVEGDPELEKKEKPTLWSRILDVVVGPQGKEGTWMALKQRDSRFVNQYGPLFEMNLGPPMVLTDVTYEQDPKTGYCYRGQLVPMYEKPVLKLGKFVVLPHHLQAQNATYEIAQGIATAIVLQSFTEPNSYAQVIVLIVLNVLMLIWLRIIRPVGDRTALIMSMIGTLTTLGTYICGLILLANRDASPAFRNRIGIAMIVLSLWSVVTIILGWIAYIVTAYHLWIKLRHKLFPSTDKALQFAKVVEKVIAQDEYILSRRYADRWMRKALKVGLHKRALLRKERNNRGERLREVAFLASLQKGRVLRAGKKPYAAGQGAQAAPLGLGAAAWPGMPALAKLKSKNENGGQQQQQGLNGHGANGSTWTDNGSSTDLLSSQSDLMHGNGLTSSQPTTPLTLEMRELQTDPSWRPNQGKTVDSGLVSSPLGVRTNTSPVRTRQTLSPPSADYTVVDMVERTPSPHRRPQEQPARRTPSRAQAAWNRRYVSDNKEN